jgi:uncharacterized protein (TIGR00255 family)
MTGYGKGTSKTAFGQINAEIKTLNHRYLEITTRLPDSIQSLENKINDLIHKKIERGRVNLYLNIEDDEKDDFKIEIDDKLAFQYYKALKKLKSNFDLEGKLNISQLLNFPEIIRFKSKKHDLSKHWPRIKTAINKALSETLRSRKFEGESIYKDLLKRTKVIENLLKKVKKRLSAVLEKKEKEFLARVKQSKIEDLEDKRFKLDLLTCVRNSDVTEEITRIKAHVKNFKQSLRSNNEIGRKLDFIAQELNREANTIAAKTQDYKISKWIIEVKSEIEKIREQIQNVE